MLRLEDLREIVGPGGTVELRVTFGSEPEAPVEVVVVPAPGAAPARNDAEAALAMPLYLRAGAREIEEGLADALRRYAKARRGLREAVDQSVAALRAAAATATRKETKDAAGAAKAKPEASGGAPVGKEEAKENGAAKPVAAKVQSLF
ncbi:MAG TPA: PRTRC system protein E [Thermopetrobacter sp.]|nr:PRTRC system protein E [Thermopetrobacter sp.]